jgi:repressor LexA
MPLTKRQARVLDFVRSFMDEQGHCPSFQEIGQGIGLSSLATIHKHISTLEQKGYLSRGIHQSRSLELTPKYLRERKQARDAGGPSLPLLGRIAAGHPVEAIEDQQTISFGDFTGNRDVFVLQVRGDSMVDDHILEGDYILVEKRDSANDGEIVVALVDGQDATLKRIYNEGAQVRLQPANSAMAPIMVNADAVQVQGRVIGVLRRYEKN